MSLLRLLNCEAIGAENGRVAVDLFADVIDRPGEAQMPVDVVLMVSEEEEMGLGLASTKRHTCRMLMSLLNADAEMLPAGWKHACHVSRLSTCLLSWLVQSAPYVLTPLSVLLRASRIFFCAGAVWKRRSSCAPMTSISPSLPSR